LPATGTACARSFSSNSNSTVRSPHRSPRRAPVVDTATALRSPEPVTASTMAAAFARSTASVSVNGAAGGFRSNAVVPVRRIARSAGTSRTSATAIVAPAFLSADA